MKKETFNLVDYSSMKLPVIVVYNNPSDHQGKIVGRLWEAAENKPTSIYVEYNSIDKARSDIISAGFCVPFHRSDVDDPVIVETWSR